MQAVKYELYAAPALQAMIRREPEVMEYIQAFANDQADPLLEIAGPPLPDELARARKFDQVVPLPCIRLNMRKLKHHLTGRPMIEIACSEQDLIEVERWNMVARASTSRSLTAVN